jgi:hypothetical protein
MHRLTLALALGAACCLGACATPKPAKVADATAASPKALPAANQTDPNAMVCATVETTGTRFTTRECHTAHEWAVIRAQGTDQLNTEAQRGFSGGSGN